MSDDTRNTIVIDGHSGGADVQHRDDGSTWLRVDGLLTGKDGQGYARVTGLQRLAYNQQSQLSEIPGQLPQSSDDPVQLPSHQPPAPQPAPVV